MSNNFPEPGFPERSELHNLLNRLLANKLSTAETQQLNTLLKQSEAARREYVLYLSLEGRLAWEAAELPPPTHIPGGLPAKPKKIERRHPLLTTEYWRAHPARFASLALTLTLLLWIGVGFLVIPRLNNNSTQHPTATNSVAHISRMQSPTWALGADSFANNQPLAAGDTLQLAGGFVEITFDDGAVVLLDAPVNFTVNGRGAGTLELGRLVAHIEKQANRPEVIPFSISTPQAQIIDQGTAFGVEISENGTVDVAVFTGKVDVMPRSSAEVRRPQSLRLLEGQTARLTPGSQSFARSEISTGQFTQQMPTGSPILIAPVSVTSSTTNTYSQAERLIDGSGLIEQGHPKQWQHEFRQPSSSWSAPASELPVTFTFDLGREYDLDRIWIWNQSNSQPQLYHGHNTREIRVEFSTDGREFTSLGNITLAASAEHPTRSQSFAFAHQARYVRFVLLSNYESNTGEVQLSEVRFEIAPAE